MVCMNIATVSCEGKGTLDVQCDRSNNYSYVGWCRCGARWESPDRETVKEGLSGHLFVYTVMQKQGMIHGGFLLWRS